MDAQEAAEVIRGVAISLREDPAQFHITVNVTGQKVTSYGGTGLSITAVGGGPGSSTIGQSVTIGENEVEVAKTKGAVAMEEQVAALLRSLEAIASQLEAESPDVGFIRGAYRALLNTWVPGVITSVVGTVVAKAVGL